MDRGGVGNDHARTCQDRLLQASQLHCGFYRACPQPYSRLITSQWLLYRLTSALLQPDHIPVASVQHVFSLTPGCSHPSSFYTACFQPYSSLLTSQWLLYSMSSALLRPAHIPVAFIQPVLSLIPGCSHPSGFYTACTQPHLELAQFPVASLQPVFSFTTDHVFYIYGKI